MLDEEVVLKTERNGNEKLLFANVLLLVGITALMMGGSSDLASGIFLGLGIIAPINVYAYRRNWPDSDPKVLWKYLLALLPYFAAMGITIFGLTNPVVVQQTVANREYFVFEPNSSPIVSGSISAVRPIIGELDTIACVACALSLYFITDSRYVLRKILFFCCVIAAVFAVFGLVYSFMQTIKTTEAIPTIGLDSFSTFPCSSHWAAFALIWLGASFATALYASQKYRIDNFVKSARFACLACATVLFASIMYSGTPSEKILANAISSIACVVFFVDTIPTKENLRRHWQGRYSKMPKHRLLGGVIPCMCYIFAAAIFASITLMAAHAAYKDPSETLLVDSSNPNTVRLDEKLKVISDSKDMIAERPIFGWGTASFRDVFAFKQGADLGVDSWISPFSDFVQKIADNGIAGLAIASITPLAFFLAWLARRSFSPSGFLMLLSILSVLLLGFIDNPFRCLSVDLSFWIVMMCAFRWDNAKVK